MTWLCIKKNYEKVQFIIFVLLPIIIIVIITFWAEDNDKKKTNQVIIQFHTYLSVCVYIFLQ